MQEANRTKSPSRALSRISPVAGAVLALSLLAGCQTSPLNQAPESAHSSIGTGSAQASGDQNGKAKTPQVPKRVVITNLWDRIIPGLAMNLDQDDPRIRAELHYFRRHQGYFDRVINRASPYLYHIVGEVQERNMPMEMALLPVVESAYDPFAYSHGRAAGLWQFIPSTGRHYGLKQNWWYDGRRDILASTDAALDYLQELHEEFNDWELALAAYNAGRGTVASAIRKNRKKGKPTDFWSLNLPRETTAYVPRLIAISKIIRDSDTHNITVNTVANKPYFDVVETGQQIDLARAATLAKIDIDELYRLNPAFNRWATDPDGPHHLLVPVDKADHFRQVLANLPAERRLQWQRYTIRSGDSLLTISKRYQTSVNLIKEVNNLKSNTIVAGKALLIPVPSEDSEAYALSAEQRKLARQSRSVSGRQKMQYQVKPGDSFWLIAKQYDVNVRALAKWNSMAPTDTLRAGQQLVIWTEPGKGNSGIIRKVNYQVRNGDNLSLIAGRFNVKVNQIKQWNTLPGKYLQPGQQLTLYVDVTSTN
ncbi:MAG: lytic transglycosylase [Oceanospirillales bacterium LUC14_002_19_P2]|nr:MAG: lytic transglycosylase [Oceanospirillales bacterium LUC14_002_19_P2]